MGITKKSRTAKVIAGFVGFATAVTMSFGTASAATTEELQAQIASLLAMISSLQAQLGTQTGGTTQGAYAAFATNLTIGSKGTDVQNLQKILNSDPATQVAVTGAGSPGNETTTFGPATKAAVIKFQNKHAADILTPLGLTTGTGFVGASMRAYLNAHYTGGANPTVPTAPVGTAFGVTLSADTPASGTLISGASASNGGQAAADLAHFTFSNPTSAPVAVTNLVFNRTGVSNDSTMVNVYLFNGVNRLTDAATVSNAKITFNDPTGIFTVPAGASMTISVKVDIAGGVSGQLLGVALASATVGTTAVAGTYPIAGNNHTIATATMAGIDFTDTTPSPSAAGDPELQTGFTFWSDTISVTTRAVNLKYMTFRQLGSATNKDLSTFQLMIDGKQVGTTVASVDANGYLMFDLSAAPLALQTGSHTVKVVGDIVGGSTKTFIMSLEQTSDVAFVDSQLGIGIVPTAGATTYIPLKTGTQTINSTSGGSLTVTKDTTSPSGNVINNGSNVVLGKFTFKATGESMKVEKLQAKITQSGATPSTYQLRNGAIFANGVQVGSTAAINGDGHDAPAYTEFSLGSSLIVNPGTPVTVEVRADVYNTDTDAADILASGDTLKVTVTIPSNGYKKTSSLTYGEVSAVPANTLTVAVGALTGSKNASYANQTTVLPQTAYKIGSFTITADSSEAINLDTINVDLSTGAGVGASEISDLYVVYGGKTSTVKGSPVVTSAGNDYSVNETLEANATMNIDVFATLTSDVDVTDTTIAKVTVTGTTVSSATTATSGAMTGQTVSYSTGTISTAFVSETTTASKLLVGNTTPKVASYRFTATNDSYTLTDVAFSFAETQAMGGGTVNNVAASAIRNLVIKSSGMTDKIVTLVGNKATSTGLTLNVPANDSNGRVVDVYINLNDVSSAAATSSADIYTTLVNFKANSSTGTTYESGTQTAAGTHQYVYKSVPTITLQSLPSTLLTAGSKTLSKFTVSADSAGPIGWKQMVFTVAKSASIDLGGTTTMKLYDSNNNVIDGWFATTTGATQPEGSEGLFADGATSGLIHFVATNEQQITTSETYSLVNGNIQGSATAGTYVSVSLANSTTSWTAPRIYSTVAGTRGTAANPSFVWTDRSANSHSESTADWNNDFKVKNLPLDTQTLTGSS